MDCDKINILHVMDHYTPDLGYQENYLPYEQCKLGHEVSIITSKYIPEKRKIKKQYKFNKEIYYYKGIKTYRLKSWIVLKGVGKVLLKNFMKKLKEIKPDVIHVHEIYTPLAFQCARYSKKNGIKLFIDNHIDNDNFHPDQLYKKIFVNTYKSIFFPYINRKTSKFLAVSPYSEKYLKEDMGISKNKIALIPLGVDTKKFYPDKNKRKKIRKKLGINNNNFLIISSGFFSENKDVDVIIKSIIELKDNKVYDNLKLLLLGKFEPSYLKEIKEIIDKEKLNDKIIFHGFVDHSELSSYYNASDIGVYPGKLGITAIEAVATSLPIILCDSPATNFIVKNDNGFSFERGNVVELTEKIIEYVNNPNLIKEHGEKAVKLIKNELSWEKIAEKSISIYKKELGEK